jgi:hypothetical protein
MQFNMLADPIRDSETLYPEKQSIRENEVL